MAGTVELGIWVNGSEIDYDPWTTGDACHGKILCTTFDLCGSSAVHAKTGKPQGTRDYGDGITVTKRLDATSPKLVELFRGGVGLKAEFHFHTPDVSAGGCAVQVALTVTIGESDNRAWLSSYRLIAPDTDRRANDGPLEPYEELKFSFAHIKFHRSGPDNQHKPVSLITVDDLTQMIAQS